MLRVSNTLAGGVPWQFTLGRRTGKWDPRQGCVGEMALVHTSSGLQVGTGDSHTETGRWLWAEYCLQQKAE